MDFNIVKQSRIDIVCSFQFWDSVFLEVLSAFPRWKGFRVVNENLENLGNLENLKKGSEFLTVVIKVAGSCTWTSVPSPVELSSRFSKLWVSWVFFKWLQFVLYVLPFSSFTSKLCDSPRFFTTTAGSHFAILQFWIDWWYWSQYSFHQ